MKLTTGILLLGMAAGSAGAQNPDIIENTRNTMKAVEQKKAIDSSAALTYTATPKPAAAASTTSKPAVQAAKPVPASKPAVTPAKAAKPAVVAVKQPKVKVAAVKPANAKKPAPAKKAAEPKQTVAVEAAPSPDAKKEKKDKPINLTGKRDPFVSPVVSRSMTGSGCSSGKRCLAIDQIALKGVVKSDTGMIAVVVNALDKAYFLRENDPVFNGYVVKITGDSIIFKETLQDKLGKAFTRE